MSKVRKLVTGSLLGIAILVGTGVGPAAAVTIDASSFATSLCGDAAFSDESDGVHIVIFFEDGAGPFGGGSYDCATGEITV